MRFLPSSSRTTRRDLLRTLGCIASAIGLFVAPVRSHTSSAPDYTTAAVAGPVTHDGADLPVPVSPPPFPAPPTRIRFGTTTRLDGTAVGALSYQWYLNSTPLAGATDAIYDAGFNGSYSVAAINDAGTTLSGPYNVVMASQLANMSLRATVGAGENVAVLGFTIAGPAGFPKRLLLRVLGPALAAFGVDDAVRQPTLSLYDSARRLIASNTGWGNPVAPGPSPVAASPRLATATNMGGAQTFAFAPGSADCALLVDLPAGLYTIIASSSSGVGSTLAEIYETDYSQAPLLTNLSARAQVGSRSAAAFSGFVVRGTEPASLLVRGIGPGLANFGVTTALAHPIVELYDSRPALIVTSSRWGLPPTVAGSASISAEAASAEFMQSVSAFPLSPGSSDAAFRVSLPAGTYSTVLSPQDSSGVGLVELYLTP